MDRQPIVESIWREKYRLVDPDGSSLEQGPEDSFARVCRGIYARDPRRAVHEPLALEAMKALEWCPGGRIHAGAGTDRRVTLINCFVNMIVPDRMDGIMEALTRAALTMQQGGGIGTDFSTLRPRGAKVRRTGSVSSGPLSFMEIWHAMCGTIMSGGARRGAMMGTMICDHPDLPAFITAKAQAGRLTNFNVSVLVTDAFMRAVDEDATWDLGFSVPPADPARLVAVTERNGEPWYVYERLSARALWEKIIRTTYDHAEPGVIFIDRVNERNNLAYCETISCTNPCGEQPLPPNGDCNLGCVNLAVLVRDPFTPQARFDDARLAEVAAIGVRFLDNVLDVSNFPVEDQAKEAQAKRRLGLGIMGLGNALQMLGLRYGSPAAIAETRRIMALLRDAAYRASAELAGERGPFPLYDRDQLLARPFIQELPDDLRAKIAEQGLRNGVMLTIAPTGTTAIYYNNVSSGLEPTFGWRYFRKVLRPDGGHDEFAVIDAGFESWCRTRGLDPATAPLTGLPDSMVTALELSVEDHLRMQAACQEFIDASISKTINCPADMSYDSFAAVYKLAYEMGCKGCTTYRPSGTRGSVLSLDATTPAAAPVQKAPAPRTPAPPMRPEFLEGRTYKLRWPLSDENFYVTINDVRDEAGGRRPFEVFIASRSAEHAELLSALTVTLSAVMRRTDNPAFLVEDLEQVRGAQGVWVKGRFVNGVVALVASVMRRHLADLGLMDQIAERGAPEEETAPAAPSADASAPASAGAPIGDRCPACGQPTYFRQEGCSKCASCGHSTCS
ncbi:adenosylcobalamin-dependent ribonucleoside-diphosphate reductase [Rhodospirillum rubrum]|uniref:Vitamin B12-dependent ribonucleotide reductase n=1 Tax=Rhodospirillum rubrum (strain ATCC 11170 / ATH 1.1.1 / DSM 467 / LMG 4362 / NCIMB 8255 / S1) TaxID=269796 RepID=Q2RP92_RHORT|nr:adenosylcobalamin-dependent ribonucleoside-diphosphate reductase [Rhodospirillum rubrum]ABC24053.1 Ribonucleotide reductase large subunit [Rhodospirillum rubrum ATCC 11170]AEO49798.1 ribonucleotide reductase large subunit [Rhodospirillum rubrum F11]MBK5955736.1 ribonucleoside-diphosphate reductase, adenosylcobalamin-dependent [Rhodospirillum rubrum]QXG79995.1 adenosylcobalamin-dependent ribonucleoside-diphosphate reductase [Rhodospirillum rubrum]HAQ00478.1 adenosylcobalamin-dependent ribonu